MTVSHGEAWERNVDHAEDWARAHARELSAVGDAFSATGSWPSVSALQRQLARQGQRIELIDTFKSMPSSLGTAAHDGSVRLSARALRHVHTAAAVLTHFVVAVQCATAAWLGPDDPPTLTAAEIAAHLPGPEALQRVSVLLEGVDGYFLGSGNGGVNDDWSRELRDSVRHLDGVRTIDDFLLRQAEELYADPPLELVLERMASGQPGTAPAGRRPRHNGMRATAYGTVPDQQWHPELDGPCGVLLRDGHHAEAALRATLIMRDRLRAASGSELDGEPLVGHALGLNGLHVLPTVFCRLREMS